MESLFPNNIFLPLLSILNQQAIMKATIKTINTIFQKKSCSLKEILDLNDFIVFRFLIDQKNMAS